jgi:hypothetical protein
VLIGVGAWLHVDDVGASGQGALRRMTQTSSHGRPHEEQSDAQIYNQSSIASATDTEMSDGQRREYATVVRHWSNWRWMSGRSANWRPAKKEVRRSRIRRSTLGFSVGHRGRQAMGAKW